MILLFLVLIVVLNCQASHAGMNDFDQQYRSGNLEGAKQLAEEAVRKNMRDAEAHFCLAQIAEKEGDYDQAHRQYAMVIAYDKSETRELRSKAITNRTRLYDLRKNHPEHFKQKKEEFKRRALLKRRNRFKRPAVRTQPKITGQAFPGENPHKFEAGLDLKLSETKLSLLKQAKIQIASIKRKTDDRIRILKDKRDREIANLLTGVHTSAGYKRNNNYSSQKRDIQEKYSELIKKEENEYKRLEKRYLDEADRRYNSVANSRNQLSNHYQKSDGNIRLTPKGSSLHVRNYVNFNGSQTMPKPKALRAKAGKLNLEKSKSKSK